MNRTKRTKRWLITNSVLVALLVTGFGYQIEGAKNVAIGWAWLHSILVVLAGFIESTRADWRKAGRSVPQNVSTPFELAITGTFFWFGHFALAVFYIVAYAIQQAAYESKSTEGAGDERF